MGLMTCLVNFFLKKTNVKTANQCRQPQHSPGSAKFYSTWLWFTKIVSTKAHLIRMSDTASDWKTNFRSTLTPELWSLNQHNKYKSICLKSSFQQLMFQYSSLNVCLALNLLSSKKMLAEQFHSCSYKTKKKSILRCCILSPLPFFNF